MALDPALHLGVYTLLLGCRTLLVNDDAGILCTSHRGRVLALRSGRDHSWHLVPRCLVLRGLSLFSMRRAAHKTPIAAPWRLTTRSTRTPTGGATRLGGRRLPWFVRAHGEYTPRSAFSSASSGGAFQVVARAGCIVLASAPGIAYGESRGARACKRLWLAGSPELPSAASRTPAQRVSRQLAAVARGRVLRPGARGTRRGQHG